MEAIADIPRWRRVIRAAGRLAALYVVAALILLVVLAALMQGILLTLSDLTELVMPFSVAFLIAFLLLASARRAGFVGLWVVLLGLWIFVWQDASYAGLSTAFMAWTVFALPLYGLGMIGAPNKTRLLRRSSLVVGIVWFCLAVAAFAIAVRSWDLGLPSQIVDLLYRNGNIVWVPFPFVLCLHEIVRVWNATGEINRRGLMPV